ncbi:hypothetical protein AAGT00_21325 [Streptomyces cavourensis]
MADGGGGTGRDEWWELLPFGIRRQVDGYVLQDNRMQALRVVHEVGRALGLGLREAQILVHDRYLHHGGRVARTPDSPLDVESLAARAAGCSGRVVAIEAVWDGDTVHDWFVCLMAITADPVGERCLATVYRDAAVRYLGEGRLRGPSIPRLPPLTAVAGPWPPASPSPSTSPVRTPRMTRRPAGGARASRSDHAGRAPVRRAGRRER